MQAVSSFTIEPVGLRIETLPRPLIWSDLFNNARPVEMEIGMGKGTFITEQAKARPETNFLGIEWANWYFHYAADRLRRNGCLNARCVRAEAHFFLREYVQDASLSVLHIYFPDPWPKARHNKRRLIQPAFMPTVMRVLRPGGHLRVVTDHQGYFEQIQTTIKSSLLEVIDYNSSGSANEGEFVGTNFERKYQREGRPFYAIAARKS